jgi:hypothetical protein
MAGAGMCRRFARAVRGHANTHDRLMFGRYNVKHVVDSPTKEAQVTLSLLMYAMMVASLVSMVGLLVADAVRSRVRSARPVQLAPASRYEVARLQHR